MRFHKALANATTYFLLIRMNKVKLRVSFSQAGKKIAYGMITHLRV